MAVTDGVAAAHFETMALNYSLDCRMHCRMKHNAGISDYGKSG